jgi:acylphosphatase
MEAHLRQLRMIVSGRVQGVGFRYTARDEAQDLGLKGWVRNRPSGEVEIVAEGREDVLKMLAAWAHLGPPAAHVSRVHEEWSEYSGQFAEFRIR